MPVPYDLFDYPAYWKNRQYENGSERIAISQFLRLIGNQTSLIDIGSGFGRLTSTYIDWAEKITLCDPSEKLLKIAKKKFPNKKITFNKIAFPSSELCDLSFKTAIFIRVMHHFYESTKILKEIFRILEPDGFLILEFANKVHFKAAIRAFLKLNFSFFSDMTPSEQRSAESIAKKKILFLNHHPKKIINDLRSSGFEIKETLSVSNFRHPIIKKIVPFRILLSLEKLVQRPLSFIYFGPSIFILAYKPHNS